MSTWGKVILTNQGEALLNQCLGMSGHYNLNQSNDPDSDTKGIVVTRVSTGRYRYTNTSVEYLKERTDLATSDGATGGTSGFVENLNITGLKPITSSNSDQYGQALIQVQLDNQREDRNIKEEYPLGQLGVFARLEGSTEEILFTIVQYAGDTLPVIPAPVTPTLLNFGFYIAIATTETVSIEMEFTGIVTAKQFDDYKLVTDETLNTLNEHTKNTENPHKVTAQQVGLGNVPNVTTDNQTPTFTQSSTLSEINSGEKLSTLFGKIKKAIVDLISHLANTSNPHSVTKSQVGLGNVDDTSDADKPISTATRKALDGKAPKTHASSSEDYGIGDREVYGHLKLFNGINSTADTRSGFAATPNAVKTAYEKAVEGVNAAEKAQETANSKLDKGFISNGYTGIDEVTARLNGIEEGAEVNKVTSVQGRTGDVTVTKADINLGNVPNVATNDQTPTYTAASSRTNINSGETLATIFGKIKKWFSDLKTIAFTGSYTDLLNKPTSMQNPNSLTLTMNGSSSSYNGSATASKSWYAPTSGGTAGYIPISNGSGAPAWRQPDYYGVCSTEGATRDKVVDIPNFKLVNGVRIRVKFTYSHAILASGTNARLNVSNTGAKTVYLANKLVRGYYGVPNASSADTSMYPNTWDENEVIEFWYDGSSWRSIPETHILDPLDVKLVRASWVTWNTAGNTTYLPKFLNKIIRSCDFFADSSNAASIIQEALRHTANAGRLSIITTYGNSYFTIDDNIYIAESQTESSLRAPRKVTIEGRSMVSTSKARLDFKNNCSIKNGGATSPQLTLKNLELQLYWGIGVGVQNTTFINLGTGNGSVLILENCDISISESQVSELPAFIADTIIMKNCNYSLEATEHSQYMCYSGIRCNRLEIDGGSISITNDCSNTINPDNFELNFIYGSNVTGYIKNCTINGAGSYRVSIIDSPYIEVATCDITLGNKASLCHYTTSTEKIYTALRDCTINYTASTYLTFGKITGCTFKNSSTGYTTDAYKLQVLCPAQITNNAFVGRSEMNFNGNKVLFTNNILQYSQSYTTFPTGSVNANNMVSG